MATALAERNGANGPAPMPEIMERVVAMGDLSKLSPQDRIAYYAARCQAAGLDPRTQPFQYITLQGKLTLYATKTATDQLIATHKLTVEIVSRNHERDLGIFEVHCRVRFPDGHHVEDFAALPVQGLRADNLCNALMKCVTKAKRRTVLSACGLGMLDETEVETIPQASPHAERPRREPAEPIVGDAHSSPPEAAVGDAHSTPVEGEVIPPQPEPQGDDEAPRTGRALYAWANDHDKHHNLGIVKHLIGWGKRMGFPGRIVDWVGPQVSEAYGEAWEHIRDREEAS